MEQGTCLDSTLVSAAQDVRDDTGLDHGLDAAVAALLTRPVPETPDRRALIAYASWLSMERKLVCKELYPHLGWKAANFVAGDNAGFDYHRRDTPAASSRAVPVLSLVGCDWSQDRDMGIGDGGESTPEAKAFPHPDARLIDLERDYLAAHAKYVSVYARETEARAEFARREEPYREADQRLLLHPAPRAIYWHGTYLRRILSDRFAATSAIDAAVIDTLRRDQLEALLEPVEARDARREALATELCLNDLEAEAERALDAREELAKSIYWLPAQSLDGLGLKARVLKINEPDLWQRPSFRTPVPAEWHELALTEIADGVEHLISMGRQGDTPVAAAQVAPEPEVNWDKPPEGFMAYPAGKPTSFINIADGLGLEAERLHVIALREVARISSAYDGFPEFARAGRLDQLRREHRVTELKRAASPERPIPTETIASDSTVYYEDAAGKAHRRPVADWISFMAQRMAGVARREVARQFNAIAVQDQDANGALYDDLRCSHRLDALHDLAFRPSKVFEAAREYAVGSAPVSPRIVGAPTPDPILALIERHRQTYAEWLPHLDITGVLKMNTPEFARAEADAKGPQDREQDAYGSLLTARPTTLPGLIAWAGYLPAAVIANGVDDEDADGVRALASMCDAILSLVPITASYSAEHLDAALIALGVELEAADARMKAADADCDARADVAFAAMPERPSALVFRESDRPFNLQCDGQYIADLEGTPIDMGDIEWMTRRPASHEIKRPVRPGERTWHDFPGHVLDVVPWPEAQARIDEIVAAWKAWDSAKDAVNEAHGLLEAEARCTAADAAVKSVLDRMAALPARTVDGMHVKLRAFQDAVPHMRGANWGELMLRSLMRDAGVALPETEA